MHPDISALPSRVFYDGRLLDGPEMAKKTRQPWHDHDKFGTYKFINVSWGFEESAGRSLSNSAECHLAADLFQCLRREYSTINFDFRIGVVSMYKAQILALRKTFQDRFGNEIARKIDFNTVDGFQGQEKDIIILSCVRASTSSGNVGFTGGSNLFFPYNNIFSKQLIRYSSDECCLDASKIIFIHSRTRCYSRTQQHQVERNSRRRPLKRVSHGCMSYISCSDHY